MRSPDDCPVVISHHFSLHDVRLGWSQHLVSLGPHLNFKGLCGVELSLVSLDSKPQTNDLKLTKVCFWEQHKKPLLGLQHTVSLSESSLSAA